MKANELRIGNYYLHKGELRTILPNDILGLYQLEQAGKHEFNPIPLTEEWLLKLGYKYQDRDVNTKKPERFYISRNFGKHREYWIEFQLPNDIFKNSFAWLNWDIGGGRNFIHLPNGHDIKYVHQLQNLYFALTGEELDIKSN